jgi:hypothetical protein
MCPIQYLNPLADKLEIARSACIISLYKTAKARVAGYRPLGP